MFVGPRPETLELYGDKARARAAAREQRRAGARRHRRGGHGRARRARSFASLGDGRPRWRSRRSPGGGGRGMRIVGARRRGRRCLRALPIRGRGRVRQRRSLRRARHPSRAPRRGADRGRRQGRGAPSRRARLHAPAPASEADRVRAGARARPGAARAAARRRGADGARRRGSESLGTFEFLVDLDAGEGSASSAPAGYAFIEANPRLQVEHTVTEEVTGVDLVLAQLAIAGGASLEEAGLGASVKAEPRGYAIQARVNMETMGADGIGAPVRRHARPRSSRPSGPGLRTDTFGYAGYRTNPSFDSLLAKLIAHSPSPDFAAAARKAARALREFRIEGVPTNVELLERLLEHPGLRRRPRAHALRRGAHGGAPRRGRRRARGSTSSRTPARPRRFRGAQDRAFAGAKVDPNDPLAVLAHGRSGDRVVESTRRSSGARRPPVWSRPRCRAPSSASTSPRAIWCAPASSSSS